MGDRDELWGATWETFYDASYYEILFGSLLKNWQTFDFVTRLLVALTASGSAVAGWALWNDVNYKDYWVFAAGIASLLSIVHATLNTPDKVKNYAQLSNDIASVKLKYETLRQELKIFPEFDVEANFDKHKKLREEYQRVIESYSPDFLTTDSIRNNSQTLLNNKLGLSQ